jgi:hypothetical protein
MRAVGHHNNTLVMSIGNYRFGDFPRLGFSLVWAQAPLRFWRSISRSNECCLKVSPIGKKLKMLAFNHFNSRKAGILEPVSTLMINKANDPYCYSRSC